LPTLVKHSQEATVFVADNASTDDSVDYVKSNFPTIKIIVNATNGGYAKGYNDALKQINAEYFVLINSDIEVTKDWLSPIITLMDSDKNIAACQPKILDYNNKTKFEYAGASGGFIDNLGYPFCRGRIFDDLEQDNGQYNDAIEVFWATGACLFVRASHFNELGGLDEDFFAHQEEIDLCWRMKNKGYKIMVEPKSVVYHVGGGTLNAGSPFKTHLNFRNNLFMLFKNLPTSSLLITIPMRLVLDGVAAFTFLNKEKGLQHILAIAKAHFTFYFTIPKLMAKRQKIKQKNTLTGKVIYSILFKNKLKGIKRFSEL
jgi:GT2 family glycosyltransferase